MPHFSSPLSHSPIWKIQKKIYSHLGVESWTEDRVPFHITNNAKIASQYASILKGAFGNRPFTLLELGGGCGKFAFLLIAALLRQGVSSFRYLLTDVATKNVLFWQTHPLFHSWIREGILHTAVLDPTMEVLPQADVVVANYFFDSIPQDLFRVEQGVLSEGVLSFAAKGEEWEDPSFLSRQLLEFDFKPLQKDPYPDFPEAAQILNRYRETIQTGTFLFPIEALRLIRKLQSSAFCMLAADKGVGSKGEVSSMEYLPKFHGSAYSFPVNFHAIIEYLKIVGGSSVLSQGKGFLVALLSKPQTDGVLTFKKMEFGPLDWAVKDPKEILDRLHDAEWDATLFFSFFDRIDEAWRDFNREEKKGLLIGMRRVREGFFPLFRDEALLIERMGLLFKEMGEEIDARLCFELGASIQALPAPIFWIEKWVHAHPPSGDLLQVGEIEGASQAIHQMKLQSYLYIPWGGSMDTFGVFDCIFLFPPPLSSRPKKPPFVREIEERFSLDSMIYSDGDIEIFFSSIDQKIDPQQIFRFFTELERNKNITPTQLQRIGGRLGLDDAPKQEDRFFETLTLCVKRHMKKGSLLHAFLPKVTTYADDRFFNEIAVDPFLEYEEKKEAQGVWLTVRKL